MPLPDQHQRQHLAPVVAAVLHHHRVLVVLLRRFDQRPAVVDAIRGRHLRRGVLARLQRCQHHRHVPFPRRGVEHEIQFLLAAHPLEVALAAREELRLGLPGVDDLLAGTLGVRLVDIADGGDGDAFERQIVVEMVRAHAAHADEADADVLDGWRLEQESSAAPSSARPRRVPPPTTTTAPPSPAAVVFRKSRRDVVSMRSPSGIRLALAFLQENERLVRRYFEPCATRLAVHHVVDANHVVTKLGIERAIAFVGARRNPIFLIRRTQRSW